MITKTLKEKIGQAYIYANLVSRWRAMIDRCYNPKYIGFHRYGGRGITVCQEWIEDFNAYREHLMSLPNAMKKGYSIDRKENNGNYEPGNVRWATRREQALNSRRSLNKKYKP